MGDNQNQTNMEKTIKKPITPGFIGQQGWIAACLLPPPQRTFEMWTDSYYEVHDAVCVWWSLTQEMLFSPGISRDMSCRWLSDSIFGYGREFWGEAPFSSELRTSGKDYLIQFHRSKRYSLEMDGGASTSLSLFLFWLTFSKSCSNDFELVHHEYCGLSSNSLVRHSKHP